MRYILEGAIRNFKSNKPKITFCEETFKVYKEKGEVYCTLKCKMPDTLFNKGNYYTFKGNARVCKGDTFNEEEGKKIARAKAEFKAYKAYTIQFQKLLQPILDYIKIISDEIKRGKKNYLNSIYYLDKWL